MENAAGASGSSAELEVTDGAMRPSGHRDHAGARLASGSRSAVSVDEDGDAGVGLSDAESPRLRSGFGIVRAD